MASLLIIGGTGFFGKSILDGYQRGLLSPWNIDSIYVLARNASKLRLEFPELMHSSIRLIDGDIAICTTLPVADYVIHAAASTNALNYLNQPEVEKRNIQAGTYHYCELAKKFHQHSRIVYCSSGAVYGQQPSELDKVSEIFDCGSLAEMSPIKQDYAAAKRDAESAIISLGSDGLSVSIARCFAFIGAYLPRNQHFAIGNFIEDGLNKRPIEVKASHLVYRSYMHADDLIEWLMQIAYASNSGCPIFNVGSEEAITIGGLADLVAKRFAVETIKTELNSKKIDRYIPSVTKASSDLGLKVSIDLDSALDKTISSILLKRLSA